MKRSRTFKTNVALEICYQFYYEKGVLTILDFKLLPLNKMEVNKAIKEDAAEVEVLELSADQSSLLADIEKRKWPTFH